MEESLEQIIQEIPMDKLYVITRAQLDPIYQCVQAGHAVAAWCYQNESYECYSAWDNQYLIYLNTYQFDTLLEKADDKYDNLAIFTEPDMGGIATAFAVYCDGELFKDLPLIRNK